MDIFSDDDLDDSEDDDEEDDNFLDGIDAFLRSVDERREAREKWAAQIEKFLFHKKSNFRYTGGITTKRVTNGGLHLRGLAPEEHSPEETSQLCWAVGKTVSDLTGLRNKPKTSRTDSDVFNY